MALDVQNQPPPQPALVSGGAGGLALHIRPPTPVTLDLFDTKRLEQPSPALPSAAKTFLPVKESGDQQQRKVSESWESIMNRRNGSGSKFDLTLNLSPPRALRVGRLEPPNRSASVSPPSSCVSSEEDVTLRYSNSPEPSSMVLVGCPRCLMYVMLSEDDPKCPKCKSTVLLDFLHETTTSTAATRATAPTANKKTRKS